MGAIIQAESEGRAMEIQVDGATVMVKVKALESYKTIKLVAQAEKSPLKIFDLLDSVVEGGSDKIADILDPEEGNPSLEAYSAFVEKMFIALGENNQAKNSLGS